jgi:hypothetical protein
MDYLDPEQVNEIELIRLHQIMIYIKIETIISPLSYILLQSD